jgi:hemin uptake protein HemP
VIAWSRSRTVAIFNENSYHFLVDDARSEKPHRKALQVEPARPARISSRALLGPAGVLIIEHEGREYRLRITQQGKLILTA